MFHCSTLFPQGVPTPVSESDANSLVGIAEEITVPDVESALEKLVEIKASLTQLPGASTLVSKDLLDLGTSSVELMESLKSAAPVSLDLVTHAFLLNEASFTKFIFEG